MGQFSVLGKFFFESCNVVLNRLQCPNPFSVFSVKLSQLFYLRLGLASTTVYVSRDGEDILRSQLLFDSLKFFTELFYESLLILELLDNNFFAMVLRIWTD